ncbi:hypothetical protein RSSM_03583 [Rhodopirellula sallentina SM41]|uniref:Uncharacterized protein n=1 Tax=Rhodopirellula sallentina SM41 TaxID=1263870 RepID=M5UG34_9BACT|nr:hypothetical protein RSSM_03583 [Rhodopirellula sallentina SM41]
MPDGELAEISLSSAWIGSELDNATREHQKNIFIGVGECDFFILLILACLGEQRVGE